MSTIGADPTRAVRACLFVLAEDVFGVDVRSAREVVDIEELTIAPRGPSYLVGVANLKGSILPVLELRPLLGLPSTPAGRGARALVVEADPLRAAILTDRVLGLRVFDELTPVAEAPPGGPAAFALGVGRYPEGPVTILDVPRLLEALRIRATPREGSLRASARESG
jgi:purine-binding chemotaxis protein CheW